MLLRFGGVKCLVVMKIVHSSFSEVSMNVFLVLCDVCCLWYGVRILV